jgi:hypothetical protein
MHYLTSKYCLREVIIGPLNREESGDTSGEKEEGSRKKSPYCTRRFLRWSLHFSQTALSIVSISQRDLSLFKSCMGASTSA